MDLLITYLVSIVITAVNFIAPPIYNFLIVYEEYSPDFAMKFTLMRFVRSLYLFEVLSKFLAMTLSVY